MVDFNKENAKRCVELLSDFYSNHNEGGIALVETPKLEVGSSEWLYYVMYSCLLDYGMRSVIYHNNLIQTYEKYPSFFRPWEVIERYKDNILELEQILRENVHPRYPSVSSKKWLKLSFELEKYKDIKEDICKLNSIGELEKFVWKLKSYGQKTGNLLIRLIVESGICEFDENMRAIPLDRHDLEISFLTGVTTSQNLTSRELECLSSIWIEAGCDLGVSPTLVDKYLWEVGNKFCSKVRCGECPLRGICKRK